MNSFRNRGRTTVRLLTQAAGVAALFALAQLAAPLLPTSAAPTPAPASAALGGAIPDSFATLIETVQPAVVNISATRIEIASGLPGGTNPGVPMDDWLRRFFDRGPREIPEPPAESQALGSGFLVSADGYVVTNNHVIEGAEEIHVILNDGERFDAELKGRDPKTDLALLKIEGDEPFPYVAFGDAETARVGDWVVAIGNPFGLGGTATTGIISARGRDIRSGPFDDFIQIDAAINQGNSGGPLFNTRGEVIGINTAIYSPNGGSVGIGFAVPATLAGPVIAELQETGRVARSWLGVQIQELTPEIADSLGLDKTHGALVASVVDDSPASKSGIQQGDVIVAFGGEPIERLKDLPRLVAEADAEQPIQVEVWRKGSRRSLTAIVMPTPDSEVALASNGGTLDDPAARLGLSLAELDAATRRQWRVPSEVEGVLIVKVDPASVAARQGLRPGDVIVMVGQDRVDTPAQVAEGIELAGADARSSVLMLVDRGGSERFLALNLA